MIAEQLHPAILLVTGFVGVYCSLVLKVGIRKSSTKHLLWWIVYQLVAITNMMYVYGVAGWILKDSPEFQSYWKLLAVMTIVHCFQEEFLLFTILNLLYTKYQQQNQACDLNSEQIEELYQLDAKPQSYVEARVVIYMKNYVFV